MFYFPSFFFCTFHLNLLYVFFLLCLPCCSKLLFRLHYLCEVFTHFTWVCPFCRLGKPSDVFFVAFSYFLCPAGTFHLKEKLCFLSNYLWPAPFSPAKTVMSLTLTRKRCMYVAGNWDFITRRISRAAKSLHTVEATHSDKNLSSSQF